MVGSNSVAAASNPLICALMPLPTLIFLKARPFTAAIPLTVRVPVLTNWSNKALSPLGSSRRGIIIGNPTPVPCDFQSSSGFSLAHRHLPSHSATSDGVPHPGPTSTSGHNAFASAAPPAIAALKIGVVERSESSRSLGGPARGCAVPLYHFTGAVQSLFGMSKLFALALACALRSTIISWMKATRALPINVAIKLISGCPIEGH